MLRVRRVVGKKWHQSRKRSLEGFQSRRCFIFAVRTFSELGQKQSSLGKGRGAFGDEDARNTGQFLHVEAAPRHEFRTSRVASCPYGSRDLDALDLLLQL